MKRKWLRGLIIISVLLISIGCLTVAASAAEIVDSGSCGTNAAWTLDSDGVLTVSGSGEIQRSNALYNNHRRDVRFVVIESGITGIGQTSFDNFDYIESVKLPSGIKSIGAYAFRGCHDIKQINLPDGLESIGNRTFYHCHSLKSIIIPDSVVSLDEAAFMHCYDLEQVTLPCSITIIPAQLFRFCFSLNNVVLPETVEEIGASAFELCSSLESIVVPEGVTEIKDNTFNECYLLMNVILPNGIRSIGQFAFNGCFDLRYISIPESVLQIGSRAFNLANDIECVYYAGSEEEWDSFITQFSGSLSNSNISNTLINYDSDLSRLSLEDISTGNNSNLAGSEIIVDQGFRDGFSWILYDNGFLQLTQTGSAGDFRNFDAKKVFTAAIDSSATEIPDGFFTGCVNLTDITVPETINNVGAYAFRSCYHLETVIVPKGVLEIGSGAFSNCFHLKSITIPDSVTTIGQDAFNSCCSLEKLVLPNSITYVGYRALDNLFRLKELRMPENLQSADSQAFQQCYSLRTLRIPVSLSTISNNVFSQDQSVEIIVIPANVTSIGNGAFYNFYSLKGVYFAGTEEQWKGISIGSNNYDLTSARIHYNADISIEKRTMDSDSGIVELQADKILKTISVSGSVNAETPIFVSSFNDYGQFVGLTMLTGDGTVFLSDFVNAPDSIGSYKVFWTDTYFIPQSSEETVIFSE